MMKLKSLGAACLACAVVLAGGTLFGAGPKASASRAAWMGGKYGLMVHWLEPVYTAGTNTVDAVVDAFDADRFLADFDRSGADWLIFTIGQNKGAYASPNGVIDRYCGAGHCSKRDLVLELAKAVHARGKRFIAYLPCEVRGNPTMHAGMGWVEQDPVKAEFQKRYTEAVREWSLRLGRNCDGWWIDGAYDHATYYPQGVDEKLWRGAFAAGNPDTVVTWNGGLCYESDDLARLAKRDDVLDLGGRKVKGLMPRFGADYLAGEPDWIAKGGVCLSRGRQPELIWIPEGPDAPGTKCLNHALVPIDGWWGLYCPWKASWFKYDFPWTKYRRDLCDPQTVRNAEKKGLFPTPAYSQRELRDFAVNFTSCGAAVTFNVGVNREGRMNPHSVRRLAALRWINEGRPEPTALELNPSVTHIQRTMKALEESTAEKPAEIKVAFYGQSIVCEDWSGIIVRALTNRYPTAKLTVVKRAIGGFTSDRLRHTAWSDLYADPPDLLFFHVYGDMKWYEEIVRYVREKTTAEIVLWSSHLSKAETLEKALSKPVDARTAAIRGLAEKYGCLFVDLRSRWIEALKDCGYDSSALLCDSVHHNFHGRQLYGEILEEELNRVPGESGHPEFTGTVTEVPYANPLVFDGNRVEAVADGTGDGTAEVYVDGRPARDDIRVWTTTRPGRGPAWMPAVSRVQFEKPPVSETWTLTFPEGVRTNKVGWVVPSRDIPPARYTVSGSVTGPDGEGWTTNNFVSTSGRVRIDSDAIGVTRHCAGFAKPLPPGFTVTWKTYPLCADPYACDAKAGERTLLVHELGNGRHTLELKGGRPGIRALRVYRPPVLAQPTLEKGDRLVICGDSITFHAAALKFGFYHQLTNVFAKTCPEKKLSVAALGFSGIQVGGWLGLESRSRTQEVWTHFRNPGWSVSATLSNKVDAIAIFLGMNDILQPSMNGSPAAVDAWGERLRRLVRTLKERTGAQKVVLCTTTPLTADPASPKNVVRQEMSRRLRKVAAEEGCGVSDFGRAVMDVIDDCRRFSTSFQPVPDFVHPQKLGHIAMARELCRAFGETKAAETLSRDYAQELKAEGERAADNVAWRLHPLTKDGAARELAYRIEWFWHDTKEAKAEGKPVKAAFALPEGWTVVSRADGLTAGEVTVKGVPDRLVNPVTVTLTAGAATASDTVPIAAPWRVSSGWNCRGVWQGTDWRTNVLEGVEQDRAAAEAALKGPWTYVTGTHDYKGGVAPGSLDPYQATFGTANDSIWAVRYVTSEKDRTVEGLLSHKTFSISGGFTLYVNGERVFADFLDRKGKRQSKVPAFRLRKGVNEIRLRVDHSSWERQFAFDLVPCEGDDLSALRYGSTLD